MLLSFITYYKVKTWLSETWTEAEEEANQNAEVQPLWLAGSPGSNSAVFNPSLAPNGVISEIARKWNRSGYFLFRPAYNSGFRLSLRHKHSYDYKSQDREKQPRPFFTKKKA